jgi:hypothetical protein
MSVFDDDSRQVTNPDAMPLDPLVGVADPNQLDIGSGGFRVEPGRGEYRNPGIPDDGCLGRERYGDDE